MPRATRQVLLALVPSLLLAGCSGSAPPRVGDQLGFGVDMARRGLWSEAYFRFQQAERMGERSPQVLNNLAVAAEALGRFEEALEYYRQALALSPGDRDLRSNYDRFISFYQSFRALSEERADEAEEAAASQEAESTEPPAEPPNLSQPEGRPGPAPEPPGATPGAVPRPSPEPSAPPLPEPPEPEPGETPGEMPGEGLPPGEEPPPEEVPDAR